MFSKTSVTGFTLLELLVSIAIFAVIGLGAHRMLRAVMDSDERVRASAAAYTGMNLAFAQIGRDFNQFVPRGVRDGYGEPLQALLFDGEDYDIEFTRGGWTNPANRPRSALQRVAYVVDYDRQVLKRLFWTVLDRAQDSEPVESVMLEGVTGLRIAGVFAEGDEAKVADEFEQGGLEGERSDIIPVAVEVAIDIDGLGEVVRVFQLVDAFQRGVVSFNEGGDSSPIDSDVDVDGAPVDGSLQVEGPR